MYALGNGFYMRRSGVCHTCRATGPCLGYSEPYDAAGGDYCKRCTFGADVQFPTTVVADLVDLWNRGERQLRAEALCAELRRNVIEAQQGIDEEERFEQMLHGVYR